MRLRTVATLAVLGMAFSSAVALGIPRANPSDPNQDPVPPGGTPPSHFTAGQTLSLDGRLGHASVARGADGETYLFASVTGADRPTAAPPMNLGIVIDRSGSMKGERIANAIEAAVGIVERMRDSDSVTVVAFDSTAQVIVPPSRPTSSARPSIESAIRSIRLGGDTCISCGLDEGMSQLQVTSLSGDQVTRMILLSDGEANRGVKDIPGLRALASRMRDHGCSISTIGVDVEFDEKIMAAIASESNGRHYFVANASGLPAIFEQEFDSLLATVARDGELEVDLEPGVEVEQVFDRTFRREGSRVIVPFGTFSANQEKTVLMKLRVPTERNGIETIADVKLAYRDLVEKRDATAQGLLSLSVTDASSAQQDLDPFVAARVARSETAETLTEANKLFESGRDEEARRVLTRHRSTLQHIEAQASAAAKSLPVAPPPAKKADAFDQDLKGQIAAIDTARAGFAAAPATATAAGPGVAAKPTTAPAREGRIGVRANQVNATTMGF